MRRRPVAIGSLGWLTVAVAVSLAVACAGGLGGGPRPGADKTGGSAALGTSPSTRDVELLEGLRRGDHVILFLHDAAEDSRGAAYDGAFATETREVGEAFRELGIPVGRVLASPDPRALDAARAAFGRDRVEITDALAIRPQRRAGARVSEPGAELRELLGSSPPPVGNTVLVGSSPDADLEDAEGEATIFKPLGKGDFLRVALVAPKRWSDLARSKER